MLLAIAITLATLAQADEALFGNIPSNVPTFRLTLQGEDYGVVALVVGGEYWMERGTDYPTGVRPNFVFDAPWALLPPQQAPLIRSNYTLTLETPAQRRERLKNGWEEAGFTFVDTPKGQRAVQKSDIALAEKARASAAEVAARSNPENLDLAISRAVSEDTPLAAAPVVPAWRAWVGHVIVGLVGLLLAAAIVKKLIMDDDGGWERVG